MKRGSSPHDATGARDNPRAARLYRFLLLAYPGWFRRQYGRQMEVAFLDHLEAERQRGGRFWAAAAWPVALADALRNALVERCFPSRALRGSKRIFPRTRQEHGTTRAAAPFRTVDGLVSDVRFAVRTIRRSPTVSAVATVTLALGIAAAATLFSVVNGVLLRPLPYRAPQELIHLATTLESGVQTIGLLSNKHLVGLMRTDVVERAAGSFRFDVTLIDRDGTPLRAEGHVVTEGYFELFGLPMHLGRAWTAQEHQPGGAYSVVLSYHLWRDAYGADPEIVGTTLETLAMPMEVIGVAHPDFELPTGADVWMNAMVETDWPSHNFDSFARLATGVTLEQARPVFESVMRQVLSEEPNQDPSRVFVVTPLREHVLGDMPGALMILFGATGTLLLIACANASGLYLSSALGRSREVALRSSLGAGRLRIARQLLTESLLLAFVAGAAGFALASASLQAVLALAPTDLPGLEDVTMNGTVVLFVFALTAASGVLFGLPPATRLLRCTPNQVLQDRTLGNSASPGRRRAYGLLAAGQITLAVVLAIGAALLALNFENLRHGDNGFTSDDVVTMNVRLLGHEYPRNDVEVAQGLREIRHRLQEIPGVAHVGAASMLPLDADTARMNDFAHGWFVVGAESEGSVGVMERKISPGLFEALGVTLVAGRHLNEDDILGSNPVVIIDERTARALFGDRSALRQRLILGKGKPFGDLEGLVGWIPDPNVEIVGVVKDIRYRALDRTPEPELYLPLAQAPYRNVDFAMRVDGADVGSVTRMARAVVESVNARLPVEFVTMDSIVDRALARERFSAQLLSAFALAALLLATVGVYGVVSNTTRARRREVAIRISLGGQPGTLVGMVVRQELTLPLAGVGAGLLSRRATAGHRRAVVRRERHGSADLRRCCRGADCDHRAGDPAAGAPGGARGSRTDPARRVGLILAERSPLVRSVGDVR